MTGLTLRVLLSVAIALGFVGVGEVVLRRRSRSLADANAALMAGMGVCAGLLFPLTLAAPHHALDVVLLTLGAATVFTAVRRLKRSPTQLPPTRTAVGTLLLAALAAAAFATLDLRHNLFWDGFAIWTSKAQLLYVQGGLPRGWYVGEVYEARYASYPILVPLYEALLARLLGHFDLDAFKPVFIVFHLSIAISVYSAVRARASARLAAWSTVLVLFVPALSTRFAAGGYADMPQAAGIAAVVAAALRGDARALPWLIGTVTMIKPEGLVFALLASAAALAVWWTDPRRPRSRPDWTSASIVAAFVVIRITHVRWTGARDPAYAFQSLRLALSRVPEVARLAVAELLSFSGWGLLWPAFVAGTIVLFRRGDRIERALVGATAAGMVGMLAPFLITTWPVQLHFEQAYFRLLAQLAPAAVVAVALAYARARAHIDGDLRGVV